jgi:hypothetical protein
MLGLALLPAGRPELFFDQNNIHGQVPAPRASTKVIHYLGTTADLEACKHECLTAADCTSFTWHHLDFGKWAGQCYGRVDGQWMPRPQQGIDSGRIPAAPAPPPPPLPPRVRALWSGLTWCAAGSGKQCHPLAEPLAEPPASEQPGSVSCGNHRAPGCGACPSPPPSWPKRCMHESGDCGEAWCNGECQWDRKRGACTAKAAPRKVPGPTAAAQLLHGEFCEELLDTQPCPEQAARPADPPLLAAPRSAERFSLRTPAFSPDHALRWQWFGYLSVERDSWRVSFPRCASFSPTVRAQHTRR